MFISLHIYKTYTKKYYAIKQNTKTLFLPRQIRMKRPTSDSKELSLTPTRKHLQSSIYHVDIPLSSEILTKILGFRFSKRPEFAVLLELGSGA